MYTYLIFKYILNFLMFMNLTIHDTKQFTIHNISSLIHYLYLDSTTFPREWAIKVFYHKLSFSFLSFVPILICIYYMTDELSYFLMLYLLLIVLALHMYDRETM